MDATKPYEFVGFGGIHGPKPCEFIGFGGIHGPKPYEFVGFCYLTRAKTFNEEENAWSITRKPPGDRKSLRGYTLYGSNKS